MRVLQINSVCGVTSTGRIAADLHQRLKAAGHESAVAFARMKPRSCDQAVRFGGWFNFGTHVLYTFITDRHGFASQFATRRLIRFIESYKPDLIHLQVLHGYYLNIRLLFQYLKTLHIPIVWTQHDCWSFTGHCAFFDYARCDRWLTGCYDCPAKGDYPISLLLDASRPNYRDKKALFTGLEHMTVVTPSDWLAQLVRRSFLRDYPVHVINNGINLSVFQPKPEAHQIREKRGWQDRFILLGVANVWTRRKGLDYFLSLVPLLQPDEQIVLVGLSAKQIRELPAGVVGISRTDSIEALAELYSAADVFVNPTLEDNFPTTNLEALACGTPVVTFQTGGSVESVDDTTGRIARQGDLTDLLDQIRTIRTLGKTHFSAACRQRAEAHYDRDDRYADYIQLYQSVLEGTP